MSGFAFWALLALAPLQGHGDDWTPAVEPASGEGAAAMGGFDVPEPFVVELVAAEPLLANPVCFHLDYAGDLYVNETFRHFAGVTDIREKMHLMERDVANRTVADRVAMLRDDEGETFEATYATAEERVRLLRDTDGDGVFDDAVVFAGGFDDPAAGIAAGVLSYAGDVFYACIPDLWRLRDTDADGVADEREVLSTGYGVNIAMLGHDLHGLVVGPDRRLYFSCGDRGFYVETPEGVIDHAFAGGVLRCELDGSNLEVFASGLRNPQELVFDDYGNLFTGDNNSDGGDRARWVHVLRDSDNGWRYGYQWIEEPLKRGPWNDEKLWHPRHPGQAAYLVPPIANLAAGPSGLTYSPGTGLPPEYANHFFLCDFRGEPSISGVHAFSVEPDGAGFALGEVEEFVWGSLTTDVDFGPDGALYWSDWVAGWNKTGKGRVYRAYHPDYREEALETAALLRAGLGGKSLDSLTGLLDHADRRVRQEAQFALVDHGTEGRARLVAVALDRSRSERARRHAVWGTGVAGRGDPLVLAGLRVLLTDPSDDLRTQAARVLGDGRYTPAAGALIECVARDASNRVRAEAALALARMGPQPKAIAPLVNLLGVAGEDDPVLRHAAVMGLVGCTDEDALERLVDVDHDGIQVRRGLVVVLRRRESELVERFLNDSDPLVVAEAARAIYDVPIPAGYAALAQLAERFGEPALVESNAIVRRVLAANYRLGGDEHAERVLRFATAAERDVERRLEALEMLRFWSAPPGRDWIEGEWRPIEARSGDTTDELLLTAGRSELTGRVLAAWIDVVAERELDQTAPRLLGYVPDEEREVGVRVAALRALEHFEDPGLVELLPGLLFDAAPRIRAAALLSMERLAPDELPPILERVVRSGSVDEVRAAYAVLGRLPGPDATRLLAGELERLDADLVSPELRLDLVGAVETRAVAELDRRLASRNVGRAAADAELAPWLDSLYGGSAEEGKRVFGRADTTCLRCHRIDVQTGTEVGPDLRGLGQRLSRLQIVESIVAPNRHLTRGFENWLFKLTDGRVLAGRIIAESEESVRIQAEDSQYFELPLGEIELRKEALSAMPGNLAETLTPAEMRDLVEYLAGV